MRSTRLSTGTWSYTGFREWLIKNGLSEKVAGDYVSRCKRIERDLLLKLSEFAQPEEKYHVLMFQIRSYAIATANNKSSAETLTATLRKSARMFFEYLVGASVKRYARCYGNSVVKSHKSEDDSDPV